jgi:FkbM family methyltransferase
MSFNIVRSEDIINKNLNNGEPLGLWFPEDRAAEGNSINQTFNEIFNGEYYKEGLEYLKGIKDPICVDLGAHIGLSSLYFSSLPQVEIFAVEPFLPSFKCLERNVKNSSNITPLNIGIRCFNGSSSMFGTVAESMSFKGVSGETPVCTIKKLMEDNKIEHIDLLKIDIEGGEYEIFASKEFEEVKDKIDCIIGESHFCIATPESIEGLLKDFTVKFLPHMNAMQRISIEENGEVILEKTIPLHTMFIARRNK